MPDDKTVKGSSLSRYYAFGIETRFGPPRAPVTAAFIQGIIPGQVTAEYCYIVGIQLCAVSLGDKRFSSRKAAVDRNS